MSPFVGRDFVLLLQRQADVIETMDQAVLAERFDLERLRVAVLIAQGLLFEIDGQLVAGVLRGALEQIFDLFFSQTNRKHAVFETVVVKNVSEARRDDDPEAIVVECPRRMLAARPAAKIPASEQNARALVFRLIKFELRIISSVIEEPPIKEQVLAEPGAFDTLQELLGDDLIGVNIGPVHWSDKTGEGGKGFHWGLLESLCEVNCE